MRRLKRGYSRERQRNGLADQAKEELSDGDRIRGRRPISVELGTVPRSASVPEFGLRHSIPRAYPFCERRCITRTPNNGPGHRTRPIRCASSVHDFTFPQASCIWPAIRWVSQPKKARQYIEAELDDWARLGVEGHFRAHNPWFSYHELLTAQTARLVGATPSEVVVMNTLTVNLHLMMVSFYRPTPQRNKILIEAGAFPSDRYAVASQAAFHGGEVIELDRNENPVTRIGRDGSTIALVMLGNVNYLTGRSLRHARDCAGSAREWLRCRVQPRPWSGESRLAASRRRCGFRCLVQLQVPECRARRPCRMLRPRTPCNEQKPSALRGMVGT